MIYTHIAALLIGALLAGGGAWKVQDWRYAAKEKERLEAQAESRRFNEKSADYASEKFEKVRTLHVTKYQTITETVEKIVDRPVYRNVCFDDDGMRALADAIGSEASPGQPAGTVPPTSKPK